MALIISPRRTATPRPNTSRRISLALCFSILMPLPIIRPTCRIVLPSPDQFLAPRPARWNFVERYDSSSMIGMASIPHRACGGRSASSARARSSFSTAACLPGKLRAGRRKPARSSGTSAHSTPAWRALARSPWSAIVQMALKSIRTHKLSMRARRRALPDARKEPRAGLRSGHMPGAFNVPFTEIVENGRLVSPERIAQAFKKAGVDPDKPVITSCGSGVTAIRN